MREFSTKRSCEFLIQHFNKSKADFELICSSIQSKMENIEGLDKKIVEGLLQLKKYIEESINHPEGILATNLRKHDIDRADLIKELDANEETLKAISKKLIASMERFGFRKTLNNETAKKLLMKKMVEEEIPPDQFINKYTSYVSSKCLRSLYSIDEKLGVLDKRLDKNFVKHQRGIIDEILGVLDKRLDKDFVKHQRGIIDEKLGVLDKRLDEDFVKHQRGIIDEILGVLEERLDEDFVKQQKGIIDNKLETLERVTKEYFVKRQKGIIALIRSRTRFKEWCSHFCDVVCTDYIKQLTEIKTEIDKTNSELEKLSKSKKWSDWFGEKGLSIIGKTLRFFGF